MIVAVEGPSGVGKSALVTDLARRLGAVRIPEAVDLPGRHRSLRFRSERELSSIEGALLADDIARWRAATRARDRGETVLMDTGVFGTLTYIRGLVELGVADPRILQRQLGRLRRALEDSALGAADRTIYLDAPLSVRLRRSALSRSRHPARLAERHQRVATIERRLWLKEYARYLGRRLIRIDARRPKASVRRSALDALRRARAPTSPARRALRRWIDGVGAAPDGIGNR
jgi:thymidylate kinase